MNKDLMKIYGKHISQYVEEPSLLILDRASAHTSKEVIAELESYRTRDRRQLFKVLLLPAKSAFLLSSLDCGVNSAFKQHFYGYDRSTFPLKKSAVKLAWDDVSNESIKNICRRCGLSEEESLSSIRKRFEKNVHGSVPEKLLPSLELFERWKAGAILIPGTDLHRGVELNRPVQLDDGTLEGIKWIEWGNYHRQ